MQIEFKAKAKTMRTVSGEVLYQYIEVPTFRRAHVDMEAARRHPRYGAYANSGLFIAMLSRIRSELMEGRAGYLRLDQLPDNVTVTPGFLHTVTIEV